MVGGGRLLFHR